MHQTKIKCKLKTVKFTKHYLNRKNCPVTFERRSITMLNTLKKNCQKERSRFSKTISDVIFTPTAIHVHRLRTFTEKNAL